MIDETRPTDPALAQPPAAADEAPPAGAPAAVGPERMTVDRLGVTYGAKAAVRDVTLPIHQGEVLALIGPSGCGKTTLLRSLNRLTELTPSARRTGRILLDAQDIDAMEATALRRRVAMVFQQPNPFPMSIFDNVAYGPKLNGKKRGELGGIVEHALTRAALWDEVKDKLKHSGLSLSGGQQQRLCIARAIAVEPDVVLMDEPCSALDPIATARIEDLMEELKAEFTIVIVTHNMQQAARTSDRTAFFTAEIDDQNRRVGRLVEYDVTEKIFTAPSDPRTEGYITGRFG